VALEFAPASVGIQSNLAWALFLSGRFDEALEYCQYALASAPGDYRAHFVLGSIHESRSNFEIALGSYERAARLCGDEPPPFITGALGHAAAKAGKITHAFDLLGRLAGQREQGQVAVAAAAILLGMGDMDAAFEWLETAAAQRESGLVWLNADPRFEPLKTDSRFVPLARRLRLMDSNGSR
jgi:tetratricopeptide (TPR) repeat protein